MTAGGTHLCRVMQAKLFFVFDFRLFLAFQSAFGGWGGHMPCSSCQVRGWGWLHAQLASVQSGGVFFFIFPMADAHVLE